MYVDHHVHLGLVDASLLVDGGIGGVVDLGWSADIASLRVPGLAIRYAGKFLAAPLGYPGDRAWAPDGSVRFLEDEADARAAVEEQRALGASVLKVTLNADAGPVPSPEVLRAVVAAADGLPVVAHAQGHGMVELALAAGVDVLAHTPWNRRLPDAVVAEAARTQRWISTLDIHGYGESTPDQRLALDNLRRFHAAGGTVLYGTDLGNGPLPVGLDHRELDLLGEAGLDQAAVERALTDPWPEGGT